MLSKKEKHFIKTKIAEWQDYLKNVKQSKLGFSKRELSNISCDTIQEKCFELDFSEERYREWLH